MSRSAEKSGSAAHYATPHIQPTLKVMTNQQTSAQNSRNAICLRYAEAGMDLESSMGERSRNLDRVHAGAGRYRWNTPYHAGVSLEF